jgi:aminodeoxyfutalosine deaminase
VTDEELLALPKADLHLHLVGSAAPATVAALASAHPEHGVPSDAGALSDFYAFRDFPHFLEVYALVSSLVRRPEDVVTLVDGLAGDLASQGARYAEVTVTPTSHAAAGISLDELAGALDAGARSAGAVHGVELAWVYDVNAAEGAAGGDLTLDAALHHPPAALVGFGVGGPESGAPRSTFRPHFESALAAGLHSVPHAGESSGPDEVWVALDELGAERIGHGLAAARDARLLARLAADGVTLEVCPSSNVATGVVPSLAAHPLPRFLAAGVRVSLGSDDPPMFGTTLLDEYRRARDVIGVGAEDLRQIARTSVEASFAPAALKAELLLGGL